ncbi:VOC family protein [Actinomadura sp. NPDC047616]|uniref:VOC family protein n=1 Tax=Actinomadura sp. NPDC047616 TaxID=3155914 RepID=UPI0033D41CBE
MTDPLEALRAPIEPVDPDPAFAARLRERVRRALLEPKGAGMTTDTRDVVSPVEARLHTLTPYLCVDDGQRALEWYSRAFGARLRTEPTVMEDGRVGHAELAIGDSVLMLADEWPELGLVGPRRRGGPSQSIYLTVPDVDTVVDRAVELGAELSRPVADHPYGRNGVIHDPFGHRWMITTPPSSARPTLTLRHGDIGYMALWVPDVQRAADFYGPVLGWRFTAGSAPQGRRVEGPSGRHIGLWGDQDHATLFPCFTVDDVHTAVRRVRQAGGEAEEPTRAPYGLASNCTDDQGMPFALLQTTDDMTAPAQPAPGSVAYLTFEVPDSERFRAFFRAVLGWTFSPGRVPDGWNVLNGGTEVRPMSGLHGGHDRSRVVPMYAVDDIEAAVARVRASGGECSAPEAQHYGISSVCTDNQGSRFYLGQLR